VWLYPLKGGKQSLMNASLSSPSLRHTCGPTGRSVTHGLASPLSLCSLYAHFFSLSFLITISRSLVLLSLLLMFYILCTTGIAWIALRPTPHRSSQQEHSTPHLDTSSSTQSPPVATNNHNHDHHHLHHHHKQNHQHELTLTTRVR